MRGCKARGERVVACMLRRWGLVQEQDEEGFESGDQESGDDDAVKQQHQWWRCLR